MSEAKLGSSASKGAGARSEPEPAEATVVDPKLLDSSGETDIRDFAEPALTPVGPPPVTTPEPPRSVPSAAARVTKPVIEPPDNLQTLNVLDRDLELVTLPATGGPRTDPEMMVDALKTLPSDTSLRAPTRPPAPPPVPARPVRTVEVDLDPPPPAPPSRPSRPTAAQVATAPPPPHEPARARPSRAALARPSGKLVVVKGNDRGEETPLEIEKMTIGRALDNDLVLADVSVSRRHVLIGYEEGTYYVEDLSSGNGTLVNGQEIEREDLRHGDLIEIGTTVLRLQLSDGTPLPPVEDDEAGDEDQPPTRVEGMPGRRRTAAPPPAASPRDKTRPPPGRLVPTPRPFSAPPAPGPRPSSPPAARPAGTPDSLDDPPIVPLTPAPAPPPRPQPRPGLTALTPPPPSLGRWFELSYRRVAVIAAATFAAATLTSLLAARAGSEGMDADALAKAESTLGVALQYVRTNRWEEAREQLLRASGLAPTSRGIKAWVERVELEMHGQELLEQSRRARDRRAWADARRPLLQVNPVSSASELVPQLLGELDREQAREQLEQTTGDRTRRPPPGAAEAYRRKEFAEAAERVGVESQAEAIRRIAADLQRAEQAERRGNAGDAMRALEEALDLDRELPLSNGALGREIRPRLLRLARAEAKAALDTERLEQAFTAARLALRLGGRGDLGTRRVLAALEDRAAGLVREAQRTRSEDEARRILRRVLKIVPPTSPWYRQAAKALD